ncbi:MAG TPA: hypothetical protein VMR54_01195 [Thermoanaerobaculia bacterium]|nr:hypothetical protein [Thermoanaerobaculia bacterium]
MFERQQELERAQGYRGPAIRFFGPLDNATEAGLVLRDMSVAILLVALLVIVANRRAGWVAAAAAAALAIPAALLWLTRLRVVAVFLLIATAAMATWVLVGSRTYGLWQLLMWVGILLIAQRASRATFKRHELLKTRTTDTANGSGA